MKYIMDTHILLWWYMDSENLPSSYRKLLSSLEEERVEVGLSIISLWEIAKLSSSGKIRLSFALDQWFQELEADPLTNVLPLSGDIILESTRLGERFHKDPADQLIAASARVHGLKLMTCDQRIINSGVVAMG